MTTSQAGGAKRTRKSSPPPPRTATDDVIGPDAVAGGGGVPPVPVPGVQDVRLDLEGDCLIKRRGDSESLFLDWAPRLRSWWTDPDGVPVYRVEVRGQVEDVVPETLRDGTAWDRFEQAAGHDVRQVREALASAVKMQRRTVPRAPGLSALGWHEVDGQWVYVTSGESFGPSGEVVVNVHTYDADEAALPPAPTGDRRRDVVALSLSCLDAAVLRVSAPAMCSVWLAPLVSLFGNDLPRFVPWMWSDGRAGVFGVLKSSFAAILQAHSGMGYRGESDLLPAADTTLPALSSVLGVRRDGLAIVDDYKRGETSTVESRTQGTMEQGIRLATNRQRRAKARYKGPGLARTVACMALMMVTAECLPLFDSGSTHDRTFPFQVHKGDVLSDRLTVLQDRVDDLPEAGAAYVAWIAERHQEVTAFLGERFRALRAEIRTGGQVTGRACSHIAHMLCAAELFTRFAVEAGALDSGRRGPLLSDIRHALFAAASATSTERAEEQPYEVWLHGLRAAFASGDLYATPADRPGTEPVAYADALGWRAERRGHLGGYALPDGLAVVESIVNPEVARRAKSLTVQGPQLRRLLATHGVIQPVAPGKDGRHEHQRHIRAGSRWAWCPVIPWDVFLGVEADPGPDPVTEPDPVPDDDPVTDPDRTAEPSAPTLPMGDTTADGTLVEGEPMPCGSCGRPTTFRVDGEPHHLGAFCTPAPSTTSTAPESTAAGVDDEHQDDDEPSTAGASTRTTGPTPDPRPSTSTGTRTTTTRTTTTGNARHDAFLDGAELRRTIRTPQQRAALAERLVILDDPEVAEHPEKLRVLAALEGPKGEHGPFAPYRRRRGPWWQPTMPGMLEAARVVNGWEWEREYDGDVVVLDRNGSWPTAVSSVVVAHGGYEHTGPIDEVRGTVRPGYYKVRAYGWDEAGVPSPLEGSGAGTDVWVTAVRMRLLADLAEAGRWPDASALDSYTGDPVRLSDWAHLVGELRRYALDTHGRDSGAYGAVKEAFGQSIGLLTGSWADGGAVARREWKCKARRTDWVHHIKDQASVTIWRTADACAALAPDAAPVALRHVDELVLPAGALEVVTSAPAPGVRPPVRMDDVGTEFGTYKVKSHEVWGE